MKVNVKLTGFSFRDDTRQKIIEMPEGTTVKDAMLLLEDMLPEGILHDKVRIIIVLLNRKHVRTDAIIDDGDELRLLCSITGG